MPAPEPPRDTDVWFFGAGVSSAFGLPNTPALLKCLYDYASPDVLGDLESAYQFLYPDAQYNHFQPDVVDFFSALSAFVGVGQGWPGTGLKNGRDLLRALRRSIARLLIERSRQIPAERLKRHEYLTKAVAPGNVIITTNWDPLVERFAELNDIPLRLATSSNKFSPTEVTLIKLHGSVDWTLTSSTSKSYTLEEYANLSERRTDGRTYRIGLPSEEQEGLVRIRSQWSNLWQRVSSRTKEPWLVTMVTGKQDELGPLRPMWRDAYAALGRARTLEVAGYSLPADDVEVRTLLRAGVMRGYSRPPIRVVDPSPATHARFRTLIAHSIESDYFGVPSVRG